MNIPQVNATVTDRNREQTRRICELRGWVTDKEATPLCEFWQDSPAAKKTFPNGSFTLCQVVGMLEAEDAYWLWEYMTPPRHPTGYMRAGKCLAATENPHDLTAALDALIKVLEEKK